MKRHAPHVSLVPNSAPMMQISVSPMEKADPQMQVVRGQDVPEAVVNGNFWLAGYDPSRSLNMYLFFYL